MAVHRWFNNFTAGELTPYLDGRSDLQQYDRGCRTMQNMRPLPYGGATIRGGLEYIAGARYNNKKSRLVPFNFSTGTRFVIEFGDLYVRFYSNGIQVLSGGSPYNVTSTYLEAHLFELQFKQINDVIYIAHPSYPPAKLSRVTDTNWTLASISWAYPPLREENITTTTLTASATTGSGITLTASAATFLSTNVGSYFELRHLREGEAVELDISTATGSSSSLYVRGDWQIVTTERWYGTLEVERSTDGGTTWTTIRKFKSSADRNVSASGSESEACYLRLTFTYTGNPYGAGVWAGTAPTAYVYAKAKLESTEAYFSGLVKVTAFTSTTVVTADVINNISSTTATDVWSEGAWSVRRGYPRSIGLFEQRPYWGGNTEKPTRFWGSKTGDFENYEYGSDDDSAVAFDIAATESNAIQWMESMQRLLIGTGGGEFSAGSGDSSEPVTPSNVSVRGQSAFGSDYLQPVVVDNAVVFLQRQGRKLRELTFDIARDGYVAPDLTLLAEHITSGGVTQLGFARQPDPLLLAVTDNHLAVMTYDRGQQITAWARYVTDGVIESACAIYGDTADEVWCVVNRTINGSTVRYVERFAVETENKTTAKLLDAHKAGVITGTFTGVVAGLTHLEGETVRLVVAGAVIGDYTVTGGNITVPVESVPTVGNYVVGLPYQAILQPMRMDLVMAAGASQGKVRRISELTIRVKNTLGAKFGPSLTRLDTINFRNATDPMDASAPLFSGDKQVYFNGGHDKAGDLYIIQDYPLPFTILGVLAKAEFFGD